jgi:outer membrane protein OmpA-like peptidoglycan-associated protein
MKLPFRGRSLGDDEYDYDDEAFDPRPSPFGLEVTGEVPAVVREEIPPPAHRAEAPVRLPDLDEDEAIEDGDEADDEAEDEADGQDVTADEFVEKLTRVRAESVAEQRSAWAYLGVLGTLFVLIVGFGYGCSGKVGSDAAPMQPAEMLASAEPSRFQFRVEGDIVTLEGSVPDQAARDQLVALAAPIYGAPNVVDSLNIDSDSTLEEGTLRVIGQAKVGDTRPQTLHDQVIENFGLTSRGFEVGFQESILSPVAAAVAIDGANVVLTGALPDEQSVIDFIAVAGEVWGAANVDGTALTVGETTWTEGRIQLSGTPVATDANVTRFTTLVGERIGTLVAVEITGLAAGDDPAQILTAQTTVDTLVAGSPIAFAPDSADIDAASDALLTELAAALNLVPNTSVEIVGHTDNVGEEQDNLLLSEDRAQAVQARLSSLGVAPARLTARGEGESKPVADNNTDAGKAQNRRIEFVLIAPVSG